MPPILLPCVYLHSIDISIFCIHVEYVWAWYDVGGWFIQLKCIKQKIICHAQNAQPMQINNKKFANSEQQIKFEYLIFCHTPISLWTLAPTTLKNDIVRNTTIVKNQTHFGIKALN